MVQQFTEAFVQALQVPDGPARPTSGFKMEVLKVRASAGGAGSLQGGLASGTLLLPRHLHLLAFLWLLRQ